MSEENTQPEMSDVEPVEVEAADDGGEVDAEDREYEEKMASLRSKKKAKEVEEEENLDPEEKEYREAMAKIKADEKKKKTKSDEEDAEADEAENPKAKAKKEKTPEKKIWKLKVNGKEEEFDATDDEIVKAEVQKGRASQEAFKQAATIRKQSERFLEALKTNPIEVLSHPSLGLDLRKVCEEYLYENHVKKDLMTKEERERHEERTELERFRRAEEKRKAEEKQREHDSLKERYRQEWSNKFKEAMETGGLPKTDWTLTRMAHYMKVAISKGHKHIQPIDVVPLVKEDWIGAQRDMFSSVDGEKLIELIGKEAVDKIRKANLKKYEERSFNNTATEEGKEAPPRAPRKTESYGSKEEMMRAMQRRSY